ncbi:MAG: putative TIM-barrel fold metal-dependent hydrolase [Alteromonadaceae bacterium]|jgi:predicted TIM-barrel fold metal-dependent hydrolase
MNCIDAHLHLDSLKFKKVGDAANELNQQLSNAQIEKGVILHLLIQPWSIEEVSEVIQRHQRLEAFVNVDPDDKQVLKTMTIAINDMHFCGIKLHPRLQHLDMKSPKLVDVCRFAATLNVPVLLDAFPDGSGLMQGFNPLEYATLAKQCPDTNFIWAHMGGHHVIDMMMLAKRLENVYFDCSYSLLYFRGSSVPQDMVYAMNSMRFERIFYGSDYPDRSIENSLIDSIQILSDLKVNETQLEKLLYTNFKDFMKW